MFLTNIVEKIKTRFDFEVRHLLYVESKLQNGKSTVKTQLYLLAMSG